MPFLPKKTIVLCFDIRDTLIKEINKNGVIFNSSNNSNNAEDWLTAIEELDEYCSSMGVKLIIQIISKTPEAQIDEYVEAVKKFFQPYLFLYNSNGDGRKAYLDWARSYVLQHLSSSITPTFILPPIHLYNSQANTNISKSSIMDSISKFFRGIPAENMFLIDAANVEENNKDFKNHYQNDVLCAYNFIDTSDLKNNITNINAFKIFKDKFYDLIKAKAFGLGAALSSNNNFFTEKNKIHNSNNNSINATSPNLGFNINNYPELEEQLTNNHGLIPSKKSNNNTCLNNNDDGFVIIDSNLEDYNYEDEDEDDCKKKYILI